MENKQFLVLWESLFFIDRKKRVYFLQIQLTIDIAVIMW